MQMIDCFRGMLALECSQPKPCEAGAIHQMIERQDAATLGEHRVKIIDVGGCDYELYRLDGNRHLPFFKTGSQEPRPPRGLTAFCDYILIGQNEQGCILLLVELKRGTKADTARQLEASACFADYLMATAKRIYADFGSTEVRVVRIAVAREPKGPTKRELVTYCREGNYYKYNFKDLRLKTLLRELYNHRENKGR